jgi:hypothetical protein
MVLGLCHNFHYLPSQEEMLLVHVMALGREKQHVLL